MWCVPFACRRDTPVLGASPRVTRRLRPERAASVDPCARKAPAPGLRLQARPSVGTGRPRRTGRPSRRARNGAEASTCRAMPRHSVVESSRIVFSIKIFFGDCFGRGRELTKLMEKRKRWRARPAVCFMGLGDKAARAGTSASMYVRPYFLPVRPYLSCFNACLASADTPVPQAAAVCIAVCITKLTPTLIPQRAHECLSHPRGHNPDPDLCNSELHIKFCAHSAAYVVPVPVASTKSSFIERP